MSTSIFEQLNKINVTSKTEKKGQFKYLSWCYAWGELKKVSPNSKVIVYENEQGLPYFPDGDVGAMVKVGVVVDQLEHISYLPIMNFSNKAIKASAINMMDVNKAVQRATVKAIGLHGLGLYIYAGEDLPEEESLAASPVKAKTDTKVIVKSKKDTTKKSSSSFRESIKPKKENKVVEEEL